MKGKVKFVTREEILQECIADHWRSDVHPLRHTLTYAVLYTGTKVFFDEEEIRAYFGGPRITTNRIQTLSELFHNKWIEYEQEPAGAYNLKGHLTDYL